jgi:hypothetical protein
VGLEPKLKGDGQSYFSFVQLTVLTLASRALALKALDQRLANSSSGSPTQSGTSQAQSSRPSPVAPAPAQNERKPSPVEMDVADTSGSEDERR